MQFLEEDLPPAEHIQADEPMPLAVKATLVALFSLFAVSVAAGVWLVVA